MASGPIVEARGYNGQIRFDGDVVMITREGFMGRMSVGRGEKRIPLDALAAVHWRPAPRASLGWLQFTIPGSREAVNRRGPRQAGEVDITRDENTVTFQRKHQEAFERVRQAIEDALVSRREAVASQSGTSVVDQLRELAQLRDKGILTDAEFEAKKVELVRRL